ncbi:MAG: DeoR/GlpR family DNA-binding transcription regulator [Sphaerochaetaceae bacterium]
MKASERIGSIISQIPYNGFIMVKDLSRMFSVTEETIRRDLGRIVDMNIGICKVHGGAYRVSKGDESSPFSFRSTIMVEEKKALADYCVSFIKPEDCVMLDSSTTALFIARRISEAKLRVTLVTNSLPIAREFECDENAKVICIGGQLRKRNESLIGYQAVQMLRNYCGDCCFVSPTSVDEKFGLTDHSEGEAEIRKCMLEQSSRRYLVVDHTKFGSSCINRISDFSSVDAVVTDTEPSERWKKLFESKGIAIHSC